MPVCLRVRACVWVPSVCLCEICVCLRVNVFVTACPQFLSLRACMRTHIFPYSPGCICSRVWACALLCARERQHVWVCAFLCVFVCVGLCVRFHVSLRACLRPRAHICLCDRGLLPNGHCEQRKLNSAQRKYRSDFLLSNVIK